MFICIISFHSLINPSGEVMGVRTLIICILQITDISFPEVTQLLFDGAWTVQPWFLWLRSQTFLACLSIWESHNLACGRGAQTTHHKEKTLQGFSELAQWAVTQNGSSFMDVHSPSIFSEWDCSIIVHKVLSREQKEAVMGWILSPTPQKKKKSCILKLYPPVPQDMTISGNGSLKRWLK